MAESPFTSVYDLEYFSGSQMFLYIGDVLVDDVTSLQYVRQQTKRPIYGYASQLWDDCREGQVLIQGSFTINFKEQGYLWAILRRYHQVMNVEVGFESRGQKRLFAARQGLRRDMPELVNRAGRVVGSNGTAISRQNIERITQGEINRQDRFDFYSGLAGYSTFNAGEPKDKTFEDLVEAFEDQVWNPKSTNANLNSQIRNPDDNRFDGFDMYVVFGNYANPKANHTVQKIIDVRLTSQGKAITIDGSPIQEEYTFLAQTTA
jgi:hypothetical protein